MDLLKNLILTSNNNLEKKIVRVDRYINGQVNIQLMESIANEFYEKFKDEKIDKVITVESSGISPATLVALKLGVDLVILKKEASLILDDVYKAEVFSFTKNKSYIVSVNKANIDGGYNYLLIDDFLARGEVVKGVISIINQGGGKLVGAGFIIEKGYENTAYIFEENNIKKHSVVNILKIDTEIHFQ